MTSTNVTLKTKYLAEAAYRVDLGQYPECPAQSYIAIYDEYGAALTKATYCIPEITVHGLNDPFAIIKNHAENEGMLEALVSAGLVVELGIAAPLGYGMEAPIVKINAEKFQ